MSSEIFKRTEKKYVLTQEVYKELMKELKKHIEKDKYHFSTICNIYFDNEYDELINRSMEKPIYKEKVRLRSYNTPDLDDFVFFEIKKKYKGVVYKRRVQIPLKDVYNYLDNKEMPICNKQIMNEIDYCLDYYKLQPKLFLAYERDAYVCKKDNKFRITFDYNIRSRTDELRLELGDQGEHLFDEEIFIMEVKVPGALPLWFINILERLKIYPSSFSKYGNIYIDRTTKLQEMIEC